jgi:hypothetical protein
MGKLSTELLYIKFNSHFLTPSERGWPWHGELSATCLPCQFREGNELQHAQQTKKTCADKLQATCTRGNALHTYTFFYQARVKRKGQKKANAFEIYKVKGSKPPPFFHKESPLLQTTDVVLWNSRVKWENSVILRVLIKLLELERWLNKKRKLSSFRLWCESGWLRNSSKATYVIVNCARLEFPI